MNAHAVLRRAGRIEYAIWRMPLGVVDERVVQRFLDEDGTARRTFDRALEALDEAAARWLSDPESSSPSSFSPARPEDEAAETAAETAGETAAEREEQVEELAEELLEQEETEPLAGELAESDELRRVQAELNAKRLIAEQHHE